MTLRSQAIAALAVLFVTIGVVFVATDSIGVNTDVFLPDQPTPTPIPPTPTPQPIASADNWIAVGDGQYQYFGNPETTAEITVAESDYLSFLATSGMTAPAEDAPFPLLDLMGQIREDLDSQVASMALTTSPGDITGPVIEMIGGVPITTLHFAVQPQPSSSGDFPGVDLLYAWFLRGETELVRIGYFYQAAPDPTIYADFRAWMEANVPELAQATDAASADAGADSGTDAGTEPETDSEGDAGADADAGADTDPGADAGAESGADTSGTDASTETEAETDTEPEADAGAGTESDTSANTDADADTESAADSESSTSANTDADAEAGTTTAASDGPWTELQDGFYQHATEANAQIAVMRQNLDELAVAMAYEAEDGVTIDGLMAFVADSIQTQVEQQAENGVELIAFDGPSTMDVNGVTVHYVEMTMAATSGETTVGQVSFQGLIDIDGETVNTLSFQYGYDTDPDPAISEDFLKWLEDNIEDLSAPES